MGWQGALCFTIVAAILASWALAWAVREIKMWRQRKKRREWRKLNCAGFRSMESKYYRGHIRW